MYNTELLIFSILRLRSGKAKVYRLACIKASIVTEFPILWGL